MALDDEPAVLLPDLGEAAEVVQELTRGLHTLA